MFLRANIRKKDGKLHRYWSVVENRRTGGDRVLQRQVLYLGEINDSQKAAWTRAIEVFADDGQGTHVGQRADPDPPLSARGPLSISTMPPGGCEA